MKSARTVRHVNANFSRASVDLAPPFPSSHIGRITKGGRPNDFDLFVIGGGSAGVRCARMSAGHGARVGIAEERFWGGTCVNVGCVPKKLLVQAGEYGGWAEDAARLGWTIHKGPH